MSTAEATTAGSEGELLPELGLMIKRLQVRHHRAADAALRGLGVGLVQWDALRHLGEHPGVSQHALAQLTFQTDQAFGTLAARLEAKGLIERVPGPGRAIRHRLTDEGERARAAGADLMREVLADSFAPLGDREQATLHRLLGRLLAG